MLVFKRVESDDDSFKDYFKSLSLKYIVPSHINISHESLYQQGMTTLIYDLAELTGIFSAITR